MKNETETINPEGLLVEYDYCGMIRFVKGLFDQADVDLMVARLRDDKRTIYQITKFYKSDFCRFLVEVTGYDFDWFLESKGLRGRGDSDGEAGG